MATTSALGDVKDRSLAGDGVNLIEWAAREMPVLRLLQDHFAKEKPLKGLRVSGCLHVTSETANLALVLQAGGAEVTLCASNPLSTQDPVAAALSERYGIPTFAIKGEDTQSYYQHIHRALDPKPNITLDDGADLVNTLHTQRQDLLDGVIGGTEETTTGVIRLRSMAADGALKYPIVAVNDAETKHLFDNRYGTGQSTLDGITRATNVLWAGKQVVVVGYGWCGRGVASRVRGMGGQVIVVEVEPVRALEAAMEGCRVLPMAEAAVVGDIFITITGNLHVIDRPQMELMKSGAILANSGHFNSEINIPALEAMSQGKRTLRPYVEEYTLKNGRLLYLLAEGRLINLAAAEGHPSSVMDMSFANQALSVEYLAKEGRTLDRQVFRVPQELDARVAELKLAAMGITIDTLTEEQQKYMTSWQEGT